MPYSPPRWHIDFQRILLAITAVSLFVASVYCLGILLVSCAGHPPDTRLGIWTLPVSGAGACFFFFCGRKCWGVARGKEPLE